MVLHVIYVTNKMIHDNSKYTNVVPLYLPNDTVVILKLEDNRSYSYNFNILNMCNNFKQHKLSHILHLQAESV